jgi:hypothetical protein
MYRPLNEGVTKASHGQAALNSSIDSTDEDAKAVYAYVSRNCWMDYIKRLYRYSIVSSRERAQFLNPFLYSASLQ